ncbi:alpha/beta fold hydrolase [Thioalbus denitrificans]|uniref:Uncharacterized protein DUF3530 n=1 Tax=Thioalbus denitrificans TaxID=547122 RepID=A0A369CF85_9GAMM|nr:alpha/beta fold hydrolase [Thioalbus denitrificans]RCX31346.1 uncharacterized protein DUF3530 [Thioalbus denitrificans]
MHHKSVLMPLLGLLALLAAPCAMASDLAKEQRWADQIVDALIDGEAIRLEAGATPFLGILTEADGASRAAIVLHGIGAHPDWPQVVQPLRARLPEHGWTTLSLQLPILGNEAAGEDYLPLMDEVAPRLDAGIAYLKERGYGTVVVVAHSMGAAMASDYLAGGDRGVAAFVGIGMGAGATRPGRTDNARSLARITLPVLDLYGSADLEDVVGSAGLRAAAAAQAGNDAYTRQQVDGANHFFDGRDDALLAAVSGWLEANAGP